METLLSAALTNSSLPSESPLPATALHMFPAYYISSILSHLGLTNAMPAFATILLVSTAAATGWSYWYYLGMKAICRFFMSTSQVRSCDELYQQTLAWLAGQEFSHKTRYFVASMEFSSLFEEDAAGNDDEIAGLPEDSPSPEWEKYRRAPLRFTPAPGVHFFRYMGRMVMLERIVYDGDRFWSRPEVLEFSVMGRNPEILKEMLREARAKYLMKDVSKTVIHRPKSSDQTGREQSWVRCLARPSRPLSTVVLDQKQKEMFVDDIKDYLEPETQKWYSDRGIPYRRGYLLHGPPGTGKSSLSFAVSGLLGLKLYVLSLASRSLSDAGLASLFEALPPRCVVLLEDIDTIDIAQTRQPIEETDGSTADATPAKSGAEPICKVSLSGLLNVIDGVASPEGRVLVLTTNHPEKLDPALIRPGRVDMKIQFRLAGKEAISGLFMRMYEGYGCCAVDETNNPDADPLTSRLRDGKEAEAEKARVKAAEKIAKERADREELLKDLVVKFTASVPERTFSPADIQGYLLQHKNKPERAVGAVEQWVSDRLEARKAGQVD